MKPSIEQEINKFIETWDCKQQMSFLKEIIPLVELYDVDEEDDWVKDRVGHEDERNIRLIRTVYLISRIAEFHAGALCYVKTNFRNLYKRLENTEV